MTIAANRVVVGYDASPESKEAVRWAAAVAQRRSVPVLVVTANGADDVSAARRDPKLGVIGEHVAYETAEEGASLAREAGGVEADAIGFQQDPAAVLSEYSTDAQLVIVGHRGAGQLRAGFLGSVAFAVMTHAKCPVAIVRGTPRGLPSAELPSIVGVDGSNASTAALDQAARWAAETGSLLRIVVAWHPSGRPPQAGGDPAGGAPSGRDAAARPQVRAERIAQEAADRVNKAHPGLDVETVVTAGRPSEVIIGASADASLVIVGARGRGDFASLLLGSVSRRVVEQALIPVYVVR